jgi:hypothetical protein
MLRAWESSYLDVRQKIEMSDRDERWEFDRSRLFDSTNYMATFLQDLHDIAQVRLGACLLSFVLAVLVCLSMMWSVCAEALCCSVHTPSFAFDVYKNIRPCPSLHTLTAGQPGHARVLQHFWR